MNKIAHTISIMCKKRKRILSGWALLALAG